MSDPFRLGQHEARLDNVEQRCERIEMAVAVANQKLDMLVLSAAQREGKTKMIAAIATAAGGLGSLLMSFVLKLWDK